MKNFWKIKTVYIIVLAVLVGIAVLVALGGKKEEEIVYEPAPPEAPRLTSLGVPGYKIKFSPEKRYYEIDLPAGNPAIPDVWATAVNGIGVEVSQAYFFEGSDEAMARITLDNGDYKNTYDIKFVKNEDEGFVLQYDDRYAFLPDFSIKEGAKLSYTVEGDGDNLSVDSFGNVRATGVSDEKAVVTGFVNGKEFGRLVVDRTEKASLNVFIIAGQGNASGEGGNAEESAKTPAGVAYTVELNDRTNTMVDLSQGRQGFTPSLAERLYNITGQKSLFIQCAVSDVSITKWNVDGEAYKMAKERLESIMSILKADDSNYAIRSNVCLWLHGEWDIANAMSSEDYLKHFSSFYEAIKKDFAPAMIGIIPVRSSLKNEDVIEPVCAAQYQFSNIYEDVRVITRFPEKANSDNGYISEGNLYYTQSGYNELGTDIATNLFNLKSAEVDSTPRMIEVYGNGHEVLYSYGETVRVRKDSALRTVAVVTPLYAKNNVIKVTYDEKLINYSAGGLITLAEENTALERAEICFECANIQFRMNVEFYDADDTVQTTQKNYTWDFETLNTNDSSNLLTVSEKSNAEGYMLQDGRFISNDRQVDFTFEKAIELTNETSWDIEWKGMINDNGIILGNGFSNKGYIFLAPFAENMGYSIRMVDNAGKTLYLAYGDYAQSTKEENLWRINYNKTGKTVSLYINGTLVTSVAVEEEFVYTFTNMFGRYASETINYCYTGSLDYLKIVIG